MKGLNWMVWAMFLCLFINGVLFDVPQLRFVGGVGTMIFLCILAGEKE